VLQRYADLDVLGKLLLFALLEESAGKEEYEHVRSACAAWLHAERGLDLSGAELTREMIQMGRRILLVPGVVERLGRSQRGTKLLGLLGLLDSPSLHARVGNLWVERAQSLPEAPEPAAELARLLDRADALREAERAYSEARARFGPEQAPPALQSRIEACARERRADTERALAIAVERGLHDVESLGRFLAGPVAAETWARRLERLIGRKRLDPDLSDN
jgi:hypothetical protein